MMRYRYASHSILVAMGITLLLVVGGITTASAEGVKVYDPDSGRLLPLESYPAGHEDRRHDRERHAGHGWDERGWGERGWREGRDRIDVHPSIILQPRVSSSPDVETRAETSQGSRVCRGDNGATTWSTRPTPCASTSTTTSESRDATPQ
ncbi:hypothetical protein [Chromohalobacter nigrandesensis]|uniref:hypothetical protein n=1 Tax=Chromohalobacter nigrandesensis TaxID=119863 RepID=UPI001FF3F8DA|nr:hypothetical protein [Chromohalobacter nigrandesensis]MCK0746077.1 hypothetical protein [Chromohalobacter nigrandesensis]